LQNNKSDLLVGLHFEAQGELKTAPLWYGWKTIPYIT